MTEPTIAMKLELAEIAGAIKALNAVHDQLRAPWSSPNDVKGFISARKRELHKRKKRLTLTWLESQNEQTR
jgi:hypothetical protein